MRTAIQISLILGATNCINVAINVSESDTSSEGGANSEDSTTVTTLVPPATESSDLTSTSSTSTTSSTNITIETETTQGTDDSTDMTTSPRPVCGNGGDPETGEECDDGNSNLNDSCPSGPGGTCKEAFCGDGFVQTEPETDPGMVSPETCDSNKDIDGNPVPNCGTNGEVCTFCGDGVLNGDEECDNGSLNANAPPDDAMDGRLDQTPFCNVNCKRAYRYVFLSSTVFDGNLGGIMGADTKCTELANEESSQIKDLGTTFRAWLSTDRESPNTWTPSQIPYVLPDQNRTIITMSFDDLLTKPVLMGKINKTQNNTDPVVTQECSELGFMSCPVWTNTEQNGTASDTMSNGHCNAWTKNDDQTRGLTGNLNSLMKPWTSTGNNPFCINNFHIYCFEQPAL